MGLLSMLFELLRWSFITWHWNLRWQLMTVQVWNFTNSLLIKMNHENGFFWDNVEGRLEIFCWKVSLDAKITWEKENQNSWPKIFVGKFTKKLILVQCELTLSWLHKSPKPYLALYLYEAKRARGGAIFSTPLSFTTALFLCAMRTRLQLPSCSNGCVSFSRAWQSKLGIRAAAKKSLFDSFSKEILVSMGWGLGWPPCEISATPTNR